MVRLINQDQLELRRIVFQQALSRSDALHARDSNLSNTGRMLVRHLNIDSLVRIQLSDMAGRLFYELPTVREHESLGCFWGWWRYAVDEMAEDDSFATAGREGEA
jgi:hypothetical protein